MTIPNELIHDLDRLLRGRKELQANCLIHNAEIAGLGMPYDEFVARHVSDRLARSAASHLREMLVKRPGMMSVCDEAHINSTRFETRLVALTSSEWTLLHKIKNTLLAEAGPDAMVPEMHYDNGNHD